MVYGIYGIWYIWYMVYGIYGMWYIWYLVYMVYMVYGILPGPPKYVEEWPFGLFLVALGHYLDTLGGPGSFYIKLGALLFRVLMFIGS